MDLNKNLDQAVRVKFTGGREGNEPYWEYQLFA